MKPPRILLILSCYIVSPSYFSNGRFQWVLMISNTFFFRGEGHRKYYYAYYVVLIQFHSSALCFPDEWKMADPSPEDFTIKALILQILAHVLTFTRMSSPSDSNRTTPLAFIWQLMCNQSSTCTNACGIGAKACSFYARSPTDSLLMGIRWEGFGPKIRHSIVRDENSQRIEVSSYGTAQWLGN